MCGIIAIVSTQPDIRPRDTHYALQQLENRGYDNVGLLSVSEHQTYILSKGTDLNQLTYYPLSQIVLGHTRWATHGDARVVNAHPHQHGSLFAVHNGIISNYEDLKDPHIKYYSSTDTEVVLRSISTLTQLPNLLNRLQGTWAFVFIDVQEPTKVYFCRRKSSLVIAWTEDRVYITSQVSACPPTIKSYAIIPEDQLFCVDASTLQCNGQALQTLFTSCHMQDIQVPRTLQCTSWTRQEIYEQSEYQVRAGSLQQDYKQVAFVACGSSYHACLFIQYFLQGLGVPCTVYEASECPSLSHTSVFIVSQSGETFDCIDVVTRLRDCQCIAVCNTPHSSLTAACSHSILVHAGVEQGVAATKSFTAQVRTLLHIFDAKVTLPLSIIQTCDVAVQALVQPILKAQRLLILGSGIHYAIVREGALKIQELAYLFVLPFRTGSLKHGPLALVYDGLPVIIHVPRHDTKAISTIHEIQARKGRVFIVTNDPDLSEAAIYIPGTPLEFALRSILVYQFLAEHLASHLGYNVDRPRNLAKSVTVA